ncbi:MAG: hypothetical protein U0232_31840 [Thermomicrobiales bacterium]
MITAREDGRRSVREGGVGQEAGRRHRRAGGRADAAHEMAAPVARDDAVREAEREELGGGVEAAADGSRRRRTCRGAELVLDDGSTRRPGGPPVGSGSCARGSTATRRAAKWARAKAAGGTGGGCRVGTRRAGEAVGGENDSRGAGECGGEDAQAAREEAAEVGRGEAMVVDAGAHPAGGEIAQGRDGGEREQIERSAAREDVTSSRASVAETGRARTRASSSMPQASRVSGSAVPSASTKVASAAGTLGGGEGGVE